MLSLPYRIPRRISSFDSCSAPPSNGPVILFGGDDVVIATIGSVHRDALGLVCSIGSPDKEAHGFCRADLDLLISVISPNLPTGSNYDLRRLVSNEKVKALKWSDFHKISSLSQWLNPYSAVSTRLKEIQDEWWGGITEMAKFAFGTLATAAVGSLVYRFFPSSPSTPPPPPVKQLPPGNGFADPGMNAYLNFGTM